MKILLTARDAGSAYQQVALIQALLNLHKELRYLFLSQQPATDIIQQQGLQYEDCTSEASGGCAEVQTNVAQIFHGYAPDFVLVGLSWQQWGVDEYTMQLCRETGIPTGVIQDYWGYVGQFDNELHPDIFFVGHRDATELTQKNLGGFVNTLPVGSPKHDAYVEVADRIGRPERTDSGGGLKIVFMGQPFVIPGIRENFEIFLRGLRQCNNIYSVVFKPHPADPQSAHLCADMVDGYIDNFRIASPSESSEVLLLESDLVVTCFSTAGVDHNYLQKFSRQQIGELIYLLCGQTISETISKAIGQTSIPYADRGLGTQCRSEDEFREALRACFIGKQTGYWQAACAELPDAGFATEAIYKHVSEAITTR